MNTITNSKNERKQVRMKNIHEYTLFNTKVEKRYKDRSSIAQNTLDINADTFFQNLTINRHLL